MVFKEQLFILLWKDIFVLRIQRQYWMVLLELVLVIGLFFSAAKKGVEPQALKVIKEEFFDIVTAEDIWFNTTSNEDNIARDNIRILFNWDAGTIQYRVMAATKARLKIKGDIKIVKDHEQVIEVLNHMEKEGLIGLMVNLTLKPENASTPDCTIAHIMFSSIGIDFDTDLDFSTDVIAPTTPETLPPEVTYLIPIAHIFIDYYGKALKNKAGLKLAAFDVKYRLYPSPQHIVDINTEQTFTDMMLYTTIAELLPYVELIYKMSYERTSGIKELLRIYGLSDRAYYISKVLFIIFWSFFRSAIQVILLATYPNERGLVVLKGTDPILVFVFFNITCLSLMCHGIITSILFDNPASAVVCGIFYMIITLMIPHTVNQVYGGLAHLLVSRNVQLLSSFIPIFNLFWIWRLIETYEKFKGGLKWSSFFGDSGPSDRVLISELLVVALLNILVSAILIWYLNKVVVTGYGLRKSLFFPFSWSYWNSTPSKTSVPNISPPEALKQNFEVPGKGEQLSAAVVNATKYYGKLLAVNKISFALTENQITVLIGENGAGKTTLLGMMTGFIQATSGIVILNGYNLLDYPYEARESLGFCPQEPLLFENLTVQEHFVFFSLIRGVNSKSVKTEIVSLMNDIGLKPYRYDLVSALSPSVQRKLSVSIALLLSPKIIIMDEPTQNMDADGRRDLWELVSVMRKNSTVLVTTQAMDEADLIADKIAIIVDGSIFACGSAQFLKQQCDAGYSMTILKDEHFNLEKLDEIVNMFAANAHRSDEDTGHVTYVLGTLLSRQLNLLFKALENNKQVIGFSSIKVQLTSLNDVVKFCAKKQRGETAQIDAASQEFQDKQKISQQFLSIQANSGNWLKTCYILLKKRFVDASMRLSALIESMILPTLTLVILSGIEILVKQSLRRNQEVTVTRPYGFLDAVDVSLSNFHKETRAAVYGSVFIADNESTTIGYELRKVLQKYDAQTRDAVRDSDPYKKLLEDAHRDLVEYVIDHYLMFEIRNRSNVIINYNPFNPFVPLLGVQMLINAITGCIDLEHMMSFIVEHPVRGNRTKKARARKRGKTSQELYLKEILYPLYSVLTVYNMAAFIIQERVSGFKHLQLMSSVSGFVYWLPNFLFDYVIYGASVLFTFVCLSFQFGSYNVYYLIILLAHGVASIPLVYLMSWFTNDSSLGISCIALSMGMISSIICYLRMNYFSNATNKWVDLIFLPFPGFNLFLTVTNTFRIEKDAKTCRAPDFWASGKCNTTFFRERIRTQLMEDCCEELIKNGDVNNAIYGPYSFKHTDSGYPGLVVMILEGIIVFLFLVFFESQAAYNIVRYLFYSGSPDKKPTQPVNNKALDQRKIELLDKLKKHEAKLAEKAASLYPKNIKSIGLGVSAYRITKIYENGGKKIIANNDVNANVNVGDCLALLGHNGAGKSTFFKCATGDAYPAFGNAFIQTYSLSDDFMNYKRLIGYTPQSEGLLATLTGWQHLELFCVLRGISDSAIPKTIELIAQIFVLKSKLQMPVLCYSQGYKRRLSMALAFLGTPPVVFLDEPYVGMDQISHDHIHSFIKSILSHKKTSAILSTHRLDDVEEVCKRISILSHGRVVGTGSVEELMCEFGKGYSITAKTYPNKKDDMLHHAEIVKEVKKEFAGAELVRIYEGMLQFGYPNTNIRWNEIFGKVNKIRKKIKMQELYVTDTTLDNIFDSIANIPTAK